MNDPFVPDRPLRWGEMIATTIRYMRRNPAATLGTGALLGTATSVVTGVVIDGYLAGQGHLDAFTKAMDSSTLTEQQISDVADAMGQAAPYLAAASVVTLLVQLAAIGVMTLGIVRALQGAPVSAGSLWSQVPWRRIIAINVLASLAIVLAVGVPAAIAFLSANAFIASAAFGFACVMAISMAVVMTLAVPASVLEDLPARAALRRAWTVSRSRMPSSMMLVFASFVLCAGVGSFIGSPLGSLIGALAGGTSSATGTALTNLVTGIAGAAITLPSASAMAVLIYIDRLRRFELRQ